MLKKAAKHLMVINASVFVLVLSVFSVAVYSSVTHNIDSENRQRLQVLSDALISSIEPPDKDEPDDAVPDVVQLRGSKNDQTAALTLQWFDPQQRLLAQKGLLTIAVPFDKSATFQTQKSHHALLLTRPVERDGHLIGFLRVGMSLSDTDNYKRNLLVGLAFGTTLALVISGVAVLWLVRQALKPVEISIQKLTQFTGDASHELKSPIMAIKTNGAVALKYSDGMRDTDREKITAMLDAANQMSRTIADLLSLAESEHELPDRSLELLAMQDLFSELGEDLGDQAASKDIKIHYIVDPPNLFLKARRTDINLVLRNVIKNAIAYSNHNQTISVRGSRAGNRIQFEIRDTGIGISEEDLPKIFDRFWRSEKARSYRSGGNGLGLAIVKSIVDRYKGVTAVKSKLGEGTSVTIAFPDRRR
jgi:signal transduction histidine kinase